MWFGSWCFFTEFPELLKAASLPRCLLSQPWHIMTLWGCLCNWVPQRPWRERQAFESWCQDHLHFLDWFGNQQFKHFNPGTCLAAYALSWCACDSSRCVPLLPLLDYLSQFSEHAGELGTRLRSLASERFRRHHAWEGRWLVRQMDRCRLSRPLSRPHQAQLGANMNKTKW